MQWPSLPVLIACARWARDRSRQGHYPNGGGLADDAPTWRRGRVFMEPLPVDLLSVVVEFADWPLRPLRPPVPGNNTLLFAAKVIFIKARRTEFLGFGGQWHALWAPRATGGGARVNRANGMPIVKALTAQAIDNGLIN